MNEKIECSRGRNLPERRESFEVAAIGGYPAHKEQLCQLTKGKAEDSDSLEQ